MMTCASCEKIIHSLHLTNQLSSQVYARTGQSSRDVSLFLVEKGTPGFSLGQKIEATWIAGCFFSSQSVLLFVFFSWRNGCKHRGVDGLKFHGYWVLQVYVPWKTWGQWGWNSMICGIQDKCGMRASMTAELVFQERHEKLTFSRWHSTYLATHLCAYHLGVSKK